MSDEKGKDFKVCVPLEDRPRNDVDRYLRYIEEIQGYCTHDFRFLEPPELRESKVKDVFIIFQADWNLLTKPEEVTLQCLHCSMQRKWDIQRVCARCLFEGVFQKVGNLQEREIYFYEGYGGYFYAQLYCCPGCGLQMVADKDKRDVNI